MGRCGEKEKRKKGKEGRKGEGKKRQIDKTSPLSNTERKTIMKNPTFWSLDPEYEEVVFPDNLLLRSCLQESEAQIYKTVRYKDLEPNDPRSLAEAKETNLQETHWTHMIARDTAWIKMSQWSNTTKQERKQTKCINPKKFRPPI